MLCAASRGVCVARAGVTNKKPVAFREQRSARRVLRPVCYRENEKPVSKDVEKAVSKNAAKVTHKVTGFLSDPQTQASAYWMLGNVALATAAAALFFPAHFASFMFGAGTDGVVDAITRSAGATLITSATVKYTLKEASLRGQLYMDTFQRLNIGLLLQTATCLVVLAQGFSVRNPLLTAYLGSVCGAGLLVSSRIYALNKQGFPFPSLTKTLYGAISVLMPRNIPATMYSLLTLVSAGMAMMCLGASPNTPLVVYEGLSGPMPVFMHRVTGAGMLLQMLVAYSLKDGADRQKLGATTFRWLNLGLASSLFFMVCHITMDWQSGLLLHTPKALGMMVAQMLAFAWTSYMYIAGESKPRAATATAQASS